jgi:hypothetical protein
MRRRLREIIVFALVVAAGLWLLKKFKVVPSLNDIFSSKPVVIDETPILIKEIKSIAQLVTMTAYDEVVVDSIIVTGVSSVVNSINRLSPVPMFPSIETRLVIIARGKVLAGTDLKTLQKENFTIKEDTVTLRLPRAIIFDAIVNPSDFEVFEEKGKWTDQGVTAVKMKARQKIIERALQKNILGKANDKAKLVMENFLRSSGYKVVNVVMQ